MSWLYKHVNVALSDRIVTSQEAMGRALLIGFDPSPVGLEPGFDHYLSLLAENPQWPDASTDQEFASFDTCLINLQLAWLDHEIILPRIRSLLAPGGRLYFVTFGPDTLIELREAWATIDELPHVHPQTDLHHLGDCLVRAGFHKPILDVDWLGVEFEDVDLLMDDLRAEGMHNVWPERRKTLMGKSRIVQLREHFSAQESVRMTFELIYGYAETPLNETGGIRVTVPQFER